jgi:predicted nucleotidyltransferase
MPSAAARRNALTAFVTRVRETLPQHVIDIRLFGSEARGDASVDSDIDVLVVVQPDPERVQLEDRIIDIAFDVNLEFGVYVSPRVLTAAILNDPVWRETPFIRTITRESVPV